MAGAIGSNMVILSSRLNSKYRANNRPVRMDFDWHYRNSSRDELKSDILYAAFSLTTPQIKLAFTTSRA